MIKIDLQTFHRALLLALIILILELSACAGTVPQNETPTPSQIPLTPYHTPTIAASIAEASSEKPGIQLEEENHIPTATPYLYIIQSGDTLSVVAFRHNVTLEELLATNPGVDPNFLIVGNEIVIPTGEGEIAGIPSPTPVDVLLEPPACYPISDGSTWCIMLATNHQNQDLENISAMLSIYDANGSLVDQRIAVSPLNLLSTGETISLAALFPITIQKDHFIQAELLTSIPVSNENQRYLDFAIEIENINLFDTFANVNGTISILANEDNRPANLLWLVVIAHDEIGKPVGIRKFQYEGEVLPGNPIAFDITVYSASGNISQIYALGEARP